MKKLIIALLASIVYLSGCNTTGHRFNSENLNLRTTFEETITSETYGELKYNQKEWLVALPAIIMSNNKSQLHTLEVNPINESSIESWSVVLSRDWGINNREDLLETISNMEYSGHNNTYLS